MHQRNEVTVFRYCTAIFGLLLLLVSSRATAQPREELAQLASLRGGHARTMQSEIHFRWDRSELDTAYMGNARSLAELAHRIDSIGVAHIDSVVIISQSSPEGTFHHNQKLSARRAATMRRYMEQHHAALTDRLRVKPDGESWLQLRELVRADEKLKNSSIARVVGIIDNDSISIDTKKWRITNDPVYRYLYRTYYPRIRNSMVCIVYYHPPVEPVAVDVAWKNPVRPREICKIPPPQRLDTLTFALKTNLLYDAVTALNFEVEVPVGDHLSVMVEDIFPWWERDNKYCFQMWEIGVEGRYWFRKNHYHAEKLRGHFAGLYAMSSKYDFQRDHDACYQGEYWSVGLTYGYVMRLSRRFNLEFSLSVGYLQTDYRHYIPSEGYGELIHNPEKDGKTSYFGPTKLKVSFVWPLHIGYKKGGRR